MELRKQDILLADILVTELVEDIDIEYIESIINNALIDYKDTEFYSDLLVYLNSEFLDIMWCANQYSDIEKQRAEKANEIVYNLGRENE